jgi:hypothetical protein
LAPPDICVREMDALPEISMKQDRCTCTVAISPDEADAGAAITLNVQVGYPGTADLRTPQVQIVDQEGSELARVKLSRSEDGETYASDDIVLTAPRGVGEHVYRAIVTSADKDGALHELASAEARLVVHPHASELTVWDVPPTVAAGERFKLRFGVRCLAGCCLAGQALSIVDPEGAQVGAANLGQDVWPGTETLYVAEVAAMAPPAAGIHRWEVKIAASDAELPHTAGSLAMAVRVVDPPDCEITIEAFDREQQAPIKGARVVMHPYRALTDENGVARVKVTKGQYELLVSASKYLPVSSTVDVTADMLTRAELDVDHPWESPDEVPVGLTDNTA